MGFAKIGAWLDNQIHGAKKNWKGSEAKKTIDKVMEKTKEAAGDVKEGAEGVTDRASINYDKNLTRIEKENPDAGLGKKLWEVGKSGGFIGMMMSSKTEEKPETGKPPVQEKAPEKPQAEQKPVEDPKGTFQERLMKQAGAKPDIAKPGVELTGRPKGEVKLEGTGFAAPTVAGKAAARMQEGQQLDLFADTGKTESKTRNNGGIMQFMNTDFGPDQEGLMKFVDAAGFDGPSTDFTPTNKKPVAQVDGFNIAT